MKTITIMFDEAEAEAYEDVLKEAIEVERDAYLSERKSWNEDEVDGDDAEWNSHAITVCNDLLTQLGKLFENKEELL